MVNVTYRARQELKRVLSNAADMPQARLRVIDRGQGNLGLGIDVEGPDDELLEHDGSVVLIVERELATRLKGVTIDVDDTEKGLELIICY